MYQFHQITFPRIKENGNHFLETFPGGIFWVGSHFLVPISSRIQESLTFCHLNKHARSYRPTKSGVLVTSAAKKCCLWLNQPIYDSLREIARCLTEIYSSLKFCQPVIFGDFLSDTDEFLSHFIEFLSNTQGYLDSLLFCQCP